MKNILYIAILFISTLSYAQSTGTVNGKVLDFESNNAPLMFAKVTIKETGAEVLSDEKGVFKFENLSEGVYTVVSSFSGYDTQEAKIIVTTNATDIKVVLEPSTLSLEDLMSTLASADQNTAASSTNN